MSNGCSSQKGLIIIRLLICLVCSVSGTRVEASIPTSPRTTAQRYGSAWETARSTTPSRTQPFLCRCSMPTARCSGTRSVCSRCKRRPWLLPECPDSPRCTLWSMAVGEGIIVLSFFFFSLSLYICVVWWLIIVFDGCNVGCQWHRSCLSF
jgi:hypothetical protein